MPHVGPRQRSWVNITTPELNILLVQRYDAGDKEETVPRTSEI